MSITVGIRREDLNKRGERRVAITPNKAKSLIEKGITIIAQSGNHPKSGENKRAFSDEAYQKQGVTISENLQKARLICGIKEVAPSEILHEKAYLFFSHTHKGQIKNRPLLKRLVAQKATLIDYELLTDSHQNRILTAFTYFAGYAGMMDSLWSYGKRLGQLGILHPFQSLSQANAYESVDHVKAQLALIGEEIQQNETPDHLPPFITCFMGNGKTSKGAQEIYDTLPNTEIKLHELAEIYKDGSKSQLYKLVLDIPELYRLKRESPHYGKSLSHSDLFKLYLSDPHHFESNMDQVFPYASIWMNCILWSPKYPRLITRDDASNWFQEHQTLTVIGDITCDPEGAIHFSKETWIDDPVFVYNPKTRMTQQGFSGEGIAVMAVTNLPCEFSADASERFSQELAPIWNDLSLINYDAEKVEEAGISTQLLNAMIMWKGKFTQKYHYMQEFISN